MNITQLLNEQAKKRPNQAAIIDGPENNQRTTTFIELEKQVTQLANALNQKGISKGDHALVFQTMSKELYVVLLALFRVGAIAVFIDPSQGREHINNCCRRITPKLFVGGIKAQLFRLVTRSLRRIPLTLSTFNLFPSSVRLPSADCQPPHECKFEDQPELPALMTFTSGSTGNPKAAIRTHEFLVSQHRVLAANLGHKTTQHDISTLPIFVLANLASGTTSVIPAVDLTKPGKIKAKTLYQQIKKYQSVRMAGSPALFEKLTSYCEAQALKLENLTRVDTGGAPVFPSLLKRLSNIAPNATIVAVYGSTEAEPIAHIHLRDIAVQEFEEMSSGNGLLAGRPVAEINCKVIHDSFGKKISPLSNQGFQSLKCATFEVGEIVVSGDHVLPGYLEGIGDEETKFKVEGKPWHRTGDLGYFDDKGQLWLQGRCVAKIADNKGLLYPFAVETVAQSMCAIKRSAMLQRKSQRVLFIEKHSGHNVDFDSLNKSLEWAKLDRIILLKSIPVDKRHNAKIDYASLIKHLENIGT